VVCEAFFRAYRPDDWPSINWSPLMVAASRTLGPLHFEDLEPHRFEDLVRQLVHDMRQWQAIEATGRLGGDEGFDICASESLPIEPVSDEEQDATIISGAPRSQ